MISKSMDMIGYVIFNTIGCCLATFVMVWYTTFNIVLKKYIRSIVEDDIVDAAAPRGAIMPDNRTFVKYVVRRLDHAL